MSNLKAEWIDHELWPMGTPDPNFPNGIDVDVSRGAKKTCSMDLPHPAMRCGAYVITCPDCGLKVGITTAGRADDPRSVKVACKIQKVKL